MPTAQELNVPDKLDSILTTKQAIREAIVAKGVEVPKGTTFREYAEKIREIDTGPVDIDDLEYLDPDRPNPPQDGKTRLYIDLPSPMSVHVSYLQTVDNGVQIDWGDGSGTETFPSLSDGESVQAVHDYTSSGEFVIVIAPIGSCTMSIGLGDGTNFVVTDSASYPYVLQYLVIGNNVTAINESVFFGDESLRCMWTSTTSEATVKLTTLGAGIFYGSLMIQHVDLSDTNVTNIGYMAFNSCSRLGTIILPSTLKTIEGEAFGNCSLLQSVVLTGSSLETIDMWAFCNCYGLKRMDLSETNLTTIGEEAFIDCRDLQVIKFPKTITTIGNSAFSGCKLLQSADLSGTNLTDLGTSAFINCSDLRSVNLSETNISSLDYAMFASCPNMQLLDLSGTKIASIGDGAFKDFVNLRIVNFPETLENIGYESFCGCTVLQSADLSGTSLTNIGNFAFKDSANLRTIALPKSLVTIGTYVFQGCALLRSVDLSGTSLTSIGESAFDSISNLKTVLFPETLTTIGYSAFGSCSSLETVTIPKNVTSIGSMAFFLCKYLLTVYVEATTPPSIDTETFGSGNPSDFRIYVPPESVDTYKQAAGWSEYAEFIMAKPQA